MKSHKSCLIPDMVLTIMAYLIFAINLIAVNIVKYDMIKFGFYILLISSFVFMVYALHCFSKDLK